MRPLWCVLSGSMKLCAWLWTCSTIVACLGVTEHQTHLNAAGSQDHTAALLPSDSLHRGCLYVNVQRRTVMAAAYGWWAFSLLNVSICMSCGFVLHNMSTHPGVFLLYHGSAPFWVKYLAKSEDFACQIRKLTITSFFSLRSQLQLFTLRIYVKLIGIRM